MKSAIRLLKRRGKGRRRAVEHAVVFVEATVTVYTFFVRCVLFTPGWPRVPFGPTRGAS
jgi:hypothetical protein